MKCCSYTYSDLEFGKTGEYSVRITGDMIESFREMTGDINPLHSSDAFARKSGYPSRVVYGMLTASLLSTLAGVYLPGERSLIHSVEVKFVKPVYEGDMLTVHGVIAELNDTVRQIVIKAEIRNQNGDRVLRGKMKVGMTEQEGNGGESQDETRG